MCLSLTQNSRPRKNHSYVLCIFFYDIGKLPIFGRSWIHSHSAGFLAYRGGRVEGRVGTIEESPRARHRVPRLISHKSASILVQCDADSQGNSLIFVHTSKEGINCAHSSSIKGPSATASVEAARWYYLIMQSLMRKLIINNERSYLLCLVIARSLVRRPSRSCAWCEYVTN
jgi:hypothetical protein